ncbi:hypothetical protein CGMCC3_g14655 [Colletotrichum fructicola]|nr:uncharacterized protein CGMCC3_g14655 [Colletotrichum fructicola]KAE9569310.1 hypothetical protein CGMCC3_g14655 [Colletotrichum fructicola]
MARYTLFFAVLYTALIYTATAQAACITQFSSTGGGGGGGCEPSGGPKGISLPNGPYIEYSLSSSCELTILNGPFEGVTASASEVASCS